MAHLVNKLLVEIACPDEERAFRLRHNISGILLPEITETISRICDKYGIDEDWIRLEKLEIDLGIMNSASFSSNFPDLFAHQFEKELAQKIKILLPHAKEIRKTQSGATLLNHFLKTGQLPWWGSPSDTDLEKIIAELQEKHPDILRRIFFELRFEKNAWIRASMQLKINTQLKLISIFPELTTAKLLFHSWIKKINLKLSSDGTDRTIDTSTDQAVGSIIVAGAPEIFNIFSEGGKAYALVDLFEKNMEMIFADDHEIIKSKFISVARKEFIQLMKNEAYSQNKISAALVGEETLTGERLTTDENEMNEKVMVSTAGIILLAPFFKIFFSELRLISEGIWKDKFSSHLAVHLLKYLSTGRLNLPEYELLLEKILCGINPDEPIPVNIIPSQDELKEAANLLESVIDHWKSLKNTSVDGLRETFLKRDGLLSRKGNDWLLQVERKTVDVLLDHIPWGYNTTRLSWNQYLINTEW